MSDLTTQPQPRSRRPDQSWRETKEAQTLAVIILLMLTLQAVVRSGPYVYQRLTAHFSAATRQCRPLVRQSPPPPPVLFEQTYTSADGDQYGRIATFVWGEHGERVGDRLEIVGRLPPGAPEIKIWRGKQFKPKWHTTRHGRFQATIEQVPAGRPFGIWLAPGQGITARVRLIPASCPRQTGPARRP